MEGAFCMHPVNGFVNGILVRPLAMVRPHRSVRGVLVLDRDQQERVTDDQLGKRDRKLPVALQIGLGVLLHSERDLRVADPLARCLPIDLRVPTRRGVAVRHVVQVVVAIARPAVLAISLFRPGGSRPRVGERRCGPEWR
jgi:hypothetical protein